MAGMKMPVWASRVKRDRVRLLYEKDALGLASDDLVDDVAFSMYARCQSILEVTEAVRGRVKCPQCGETILHKARLEDTLLCTSCAWELPWSSYKKGYKGKQLFGGGAVQAFVEYARDFPSAKTPAQRMILIDRLIHECHKFPTDADSPQLWTRPAAINLIDGKLDDILVLLETLAYGEQSVPGALERLATWRAKVGSAQREGYGKRDSTTGRPG